MSYGTLDLAWLNSSFGYGAFTLYGRLSQNLSPGFLNSFLRSEPQSARTLVWPLSISLATTLEIDLSFSSSGYLDVSVHRVPFHTLWIGVWMTGVFPAGFPHSDISGSLDICSSPKLFAAYHVFHRLSVPRHPPCALFRMTSLLICSVIPGGLLVRCIYNFFFTSFLTMPRMSGNVYLSINSCFLYLRIGFNVKFSRYMLLPQAVQSHN